MELDRPATLDAKAFDKTENEELISIRNACRVLRASSVALSFLADKLIDFYSSEIDAIPLASSDHAVQMVVSLLESVEGEEI